MTIVNATTARKSLYQLIADVNDTSIPVTITSKGKMPFWFQKKIGRLYKKPFILIQCQGW